MLLTDGVGTDSLTASDFFLSSNLTQKCFFWDSKKWGGEFLTVNT